MMKSSELVAMLLDARRRTIELVGDLTDEQMKVPLLGIINPPVWEMGHVAFFQEFWILRHLRGAAASIYPNADPIWNSAVIPHDDRWESSLPSRAATLRYMEEVLNRVIEALPQGEVTDQEAYFHWLAIMHEDMHDEAFTYTRQTLGYVAPPAVGPPAPASPRLGASGDAEIPGGTFLLGAKIGECFVFDNEKWEHPVDVRPFRMARLPVTNGEFAAFVDAGGYQRREFWSDEGWMWREKEGAGHPVYWIRDSGRGWARRHYDQVVPLGEELPIIHVNWYEAEAHSNWAGRRLPTEAEWELAATTFEKRRFPWGDETPSPERAQLDFRNVGCIPAGELPAGDSAHGVRQLIGNVWEWTATDFQPYPGFVIDPYKEYSQPWFGSERKVLRGGCWATRSRLIRNTWRNFYPKDRRDVFGGFRTCARDE